MRGKPISLTPERLPSFHPVGGTIKFTEGTGKTRITDDSKMLEVDDKMIDKWVRDQSKEVWE
jgi:hypothetical protein